MEKISFSILSGGQNSRIGINKAFLNIKGTLIIDRLISIANVFAQRMIITNEPKLYEHLGLEVYTDVIPYKGPMSGIHSALINSKFDDTFVISCDMPFITLSTIQLIIEQHNKSDITVPVLDDKTFFVCGVYSKNILEELTAYLNYGAQIHKGKNRYFALYQLEKMFKINKININDLSISKFEFTNINTFDDLKRINSQNM